MPAEETKHDLFLKRAQVTVAILAGLATLILSVYNVKKSVFTDNLPGSVALTVKTDNGRLLRGAYVQLFNSQNVLINAAETRGSGEYGYKDILPGSYIVKISKDGFEPAMMTAQIDSKKTTSLDFILKALSRPAGGQASPVSNPLKAALEDAGASWIRKVAGKYTESEKQSATQAPQN